MRTEPGIVSRKSRQSGRSDHVWHVHLTTTCILKPGQKIKPSLCLSCNIVIICHHSDSDGLRLYLSPPSKKALDVLPADTPIWRWSYIFSAVPSNKDVNHRNPDRRLVILLLSSVTSYMFLSVFSGKHLPPYEIWGSISPWTLTQCPVYELAISLQALAAGILEGGGREYIAAFPGRQLLLFPALVSNRAALYAVRFPWMSALMYLPLLHILAFYGFTSQLASPPEDCCVYRQHIYTLLDMFMFPSISTFFFSAGVARIDNFAAL